MKKVIRITLILILTIFSFYYTDKIIYLSKMKDPLMIKINKYQEKNKNNYINGTLTKDTMLVGSSGKKIDIDKSYEKMKKINGFSEKLLEYQSISPVINKKDNLDKLIKGKKTSDRNISLIFKTNDMDKINQIIYILNKNKIVATFFIDGKTVENNLLEITNYFKNNLYLGFYGYGNRDDTLSIKYTKGLITNNNLLLSNYCLYKDKIFLDSCISNKINTIIGTKIDKNLYNYMKYKKENGLIYEIEVNSYNIKELNSTIIYLKQKGYNLLSLDDLLKE